MDVFCHYSSSGAPDRHAIATGERRIELQFSVDWGADDLRDLHVKPLVFCSFKHLSAWAAERAEQHDGAVVKDGNT